MQKQPDIRWRDKDVEELRRVVKNFNAKINRVKKNKPDIAEFQPEMLKVSALKKSFQSRRDFNNKIKEIKRYSRKGVEEIVTGKKGLTLSIWEKKEVSIDTATLNRQLTKEAKKAGISAEKGTSQMLEQQNLRHRKFSIDKTRKEFEKFKAGIEKRLMDKDREKNLKKYLQGYKDAIVRFLGEDGDELLDYINMKVQDVEKFYLNSLDDPILSIAFISDPLKAKQIAESALNKWKAIFK